MGDRTGTQRNNARLAAKAEPEPPRITTASEVEMQLNALLDKHERWLMAQPELLHLWSLSRPVRRHVATLIARELLTIPHRAVNESTPPNRVMRRQILKAIKKGMKR